MIKNDQFNEQQSLIRYSYQGLSHSGTSYKLTTYHSQVFTNPYTEVTYYICKEVVEYINVKLTQVNCFMCGPDYPRVYIGMDLNEETLMYEIDKLICTP